MSIGEEPAKLLLPYLQRADELQKHEPLVAYYCRLYSMERGLRIPQTQRTKTTNALLVSLMNQLEKDKQSLKLCAEDNLYIEGFSLNVFAKADKQDRSGRADINTAKTFYAASIFFEILSQFGELHPDMVQKQKYASWKAADIRKALKEGRKPEPGHPGDDKDPPLSNPSADSHLNSVIPDLPSEEGVDGTMNGRPSPHPSNLREDQLYSRGSYASSESTENVVPPQNYHTHEAGTFHSHPNLPFNNSFADPLNVSEDQLYPQGSYYSSEGAKNVVHPQNYHTNEAAMIRSHSNLPFFNSFARGSAPSPPAHYSPIYHENEGSSFPVLGEKQYIDPLAGAEQSHSVPMVQTHEYRTAYQPSMDRIGEAHKAARFAVGALAFDDVPTAIEHLKKSLELLTIPPSYM